MTVHFAPALSNQHFLAAAACSHRPQCPPRSRPSAGNLGTGRLQSRRSNSPRPRKPSRNGRRPRFGPMRISVARMRKLQNIRFEWVVKPDMRDKRFAALRQFVKKHDHARVPTEFAGDPALGLWVSTQRRAYAAELERKAGREPSCARRTIRYQCGAREEAATHQVRVGGDEARHVGRAFRGAAAVREGARPRQGAHGVRRRPGLGRVGQHPAAPTPTRPHTHAPTHPRIHAPTHPRTHAPMHPRTHAPTRPRTHAPTHPRTHAPMHCNAPTHPRTHAPTHPFTNSSWSPKEKGWGGRGERWPPAPQRCVKRRRTVLE